MRSGIARIVMAPLALGAGAAQTAAGAARSGGLLLAQAQSGSEGVSVTSSGKNYIVEIFVTLALFGLALWMVCRSSRRVSAQPPIRAAWPPSR